MYYSPLTLTKVFIMPVFVFIKKYDVPLLLHTWQVSLKQQ